VQPCRYGLFALHWILEVNGQPTPDLDSFLGVVQPLRDGDFARVKVCHLETTQHKVNSTIWFAPTATEWCAFKNLVVT
jgi:hypothetical protein